MFVLYEEDGDIKAGTILADNDSSLQIESQHGKRGKLKAAHVLLRYAAPTPTQVMDSARALRDELDLDFLWEVAGEAEFGFEDLAQEYFGHKPAAPESTAIVLALHQAPIYFQKKGKGRYKAAPAETLAAAKLGLERKAREAALRAEWVAMLVRGELPESMGAKVFELAHKPDKNSLEFKALSDACAETNLSAVRLLDKCGAIPSSLEFHRQAFLLTHFPRGLAFPALAAPLPPPELPAGDAPAFSIDDAATTEIDDAFSVIFRDDGSVRVGIHIAAPALGITPGSDLDKLAATRLSTRWPRIAIARRCRCTLKSGRITPSRACPPRRIRSASPPICAMKRWSRCSTRRPSASRVRTTHSGANWNGCSASPSISKSVAARRIRCNGMTTCSR